MESPQQRFMVLCQAHGDQIQAVRGLFHSESKIDINKKDEDGRTGFHWACPAGNVEIAQYLISRKADIHTQDDTSGISPLHSACSAGKVKVAQLLLSHGSNVNVQTVNMQRPLHYGFDFERLFACSKGHFEIARLVLEHGASINAQDNSGSTALHRAVSTGRVEICQLLLQSSGIRVNTQDKQKYTALHLAAIEGNKDIVVALIHHGALLDPLNDEGKTAFDLGTSEVKYIMQESWKQLHG